MVLPLIALALAAAPEFSFGFTNGDGTRILALPPVSGAARLTRAVCDGRLVQLEYLREQPAGAKDTMRQTAANFSQVKGALYKPVSSGAQRLSKGTMPADAMCLMGTSAAFSKRKLLRVAAETGPCDEKAQALAAELTKRKVSQCVATGSLPGARLSFANFEAEGKSALAALVLEPEEGQASARKFDAVYEQDSVSCWRVDDGCEFDASSYRVAFGMSGPAGLELYTLWAGAEGENADLLRVKGSELVGVASASRYWSPL
jgi:hypothetical protein